MLNKPRVVISDIIGVALIYLGFLFLLIFLHLVTINAVGSNFQVLNTTFMIMLRIYIGMLILGSTYLVVHLLLYLTWYTTTPKWYKLQQEKEEQIRR